MHRGQINTTNRRRTADERARGIQPRKRAWGKADILKRYGLSVAEYDAMLEAQGGVCFICRKPETRRSSNPLRLCELVVDHNHSTGAVRALLCHACNLGLGCFKEDPELMLRAIDYLERHKQPRAA